MKKIYEKYTISKNGIVKKVGRKQPMAQRPQKGYMIVQLTTPKGKKNIRVHRLVAEAYIPNPQKLPYVNHKNGIRHDNRWTNLEWCNATHNVRHSISMGTAAQIKQRLLTQEDLKMIRGLRTEWFGPTKIARVLGLPYYPVLNYLQGKNYTFEPVPKKYQL